MDLRVSYGLYNTQNFARPKTARQDAPAQPREASPVPNLPVKSDIVAVTAVKGQTRLTAENREELANGYRRSQTFEKPDGRKFTRIEELAITDRGARRTVIQQNPSGSVTRYEETLEREDGGNYRRIQKFQDEAGETSVTVSSDYKVTDPFILSGGGISPSFSRIQAFQPARGTQLDLRA